MQCVRCGGVQGRMAGRDRQGRQMHACSACRWCHSEHSVSAFCGYRFPDEMRLCWLLGSSGCLRSAANATRRYVCCTSLMIGSVSCPDRSGRGRYRALAWLC